jgi:uncharacterized repeat protein (TIGR03803 family)
VYSLDYSAKEHVLYRFTGKPNGGGPIGNLVFLDGKLYGTTLYGGICGWGTVFEVTLSGTERVLYQPSCTGSDIAYPFGLVALRGVLYGTSQEGGTRRHGALYSLTTRGEEQVLRSFTARNGRPIGSLIAVNGTLYGATATGGYGYGSIYGFSGPGFFHVLYRFKGVPDGALPYAGLTDVKGALYGTTDQGGSWCRYQYCQNGYGTVFRISP